MGAVCGRGAAGAGVCPNDGLVINKTDKLSQNSVLILHYASMRACACGPTARVISPRSIAVERRVMLRSSSGFDAAGSRYVRSIITAAARGIPYRQDKQSGLRQTLGTCPPSLERWRVRRSLEREAEPV